MSAETQQHIIFVFTLSYIFSSFVGAILFTIVWRVTRSDRIGLREQVTTDRRLARLRRSAAIRNEYIGGVMALAFWLYATAAAITIIRIFHLIDVPWERGLVTTFLLVTGNFIEMTVAIALVYARIHMNRGPN